MNAFPSSTNNGMGYVDQQKGMDLRDYFAAKAMQGFLAIHPNEWHDMYPDSEPMMVNVPKLAYQFADAMMKARTNEAH